jgi:hypothetical protein
MIKYEWLRALYVLPEDGTVMPKHFEVTVMSYISAFSWYIKRKYDTAVVNFKYSYIM